MFTLTANSPIGILTIACSNECTALTGLWIEGQRYFGSGYTEEMIPDERIPLLLQARDWLMRYFNGERPEIGELPLAPVGTPFRRRVWHNLCLIPYGEVTTYGAIAEKLAVEDGIPRMSAQAVGGAVGHNPISIIIPCHRVIGSGGSLTGYGGGLDRKIMLLELERRSSPKR